MSEDLREDLQEIDGVGPATAQKIVTVLEDHNPGASGSLDIDTARENVVTALEYHDQGDYGYAAKFLRQAMEALDDAV